MPYAVVWLHFNKSCFHIGTFWLTLCGLNYIFFICIVILSKLFHLENTIKIYLMICLIRSFSFVSSLKKFIFSLDNPYPLCHSRRTCRDRTSTAYATLTWPSTDRCSVTWLSGSSRHWSNSWRLPYSHLPVGCLNSWRPQYSHLSVDCLNSWRPPYSHLSVGCLDIIEKTCRW